jgi:toxin ParE1/3/4
VAWTLRLAARAKQDISDILAWTGENFGRQQAGTYAETLTLALEALVEGPNVLGAKPRDDIFPGVVVLHVARNGRKGRHFVVFRVGAENCIDVLRVLHDSMDLPGHFEH